MSRTIWTWGGNQYGQLGINLAESQNYFSFDYDRSSPVSVIAIDNMVWNKVACGGHSAAAIRDDGTLWTWGLNAFGELGIGVWGNGNNIGDIAENRSSPVEVLGGFTDWIDVSCHFSGMLAIRKDGTLWAWGAPWGAGSIDYDVIFGYRSSPTNVGGGITDWHKISLDGSHDAALAQRSDGSLWGWGNNSNGEIGDGTRISRESPVSILGSFTDWIDFIGGGSSFGIRQNGTLWSWGRNTHGTLGHNDTVNRSSPTMISGHNDWLRVAVSSEIFGRNHATAIRANGYIYSWGYNTYGQLGDGTTVTKSTPTRVAGGFADWSEVSNGEAWTVALRKNGTLWAWGNHGNKGFKGYGVLGDGTLENRSSPVSVLGGFTDWIDVCTTDGLTIALRGDPIAEPSYVYTWGANSQFGALGINEEFGYRSSPTSIIGPNYTDWSHISSNRHTNALLRRNGDVWVWGYGNGGMSGDNTSGFGQYKSSPVQVIGDLTFKSISTGSYQIFGIDADKTMWAWGSNSQGALGIGESQGYRSSPVNVLGGFNDWLDIASYTWSNTAIRQNGTLWSWGGNNFGQLGDGSIQDQSSPIPVIGGITDWVEVASSRWSRFAIRSNGTVWSWGSPRGGILGRTDMAYRSSPVLIPYFTDWKKVDGGFAHAAGIRENGTLWAWGGSMMFNGTYTDGALGDGTNNLRSSPVSVVGGFTDWSDVSCGLSMTVAVRENGTIWAWGANWGGQLGDGTTMYRSSPVSVIGGFTDWVDASAGWYHNAALRGGALVDQGPPRFTGKARFPLVIQPFQRKLMELPEGIHLSLKGNSIINAIEINGEDANTISDIEYKENIRDLQNAMDIVNRLRGVSFRWKDTDEKSIGMIAQEVEEILPEVVFDSGDTKSISYDVIVSVLIEGIKEHQHKINRLRNAISKYEKMLGIKDGN